MDRYAKIRDDNLKEQNRRFHEASENFSDVAKLLEKKRKFISTFDLAILEPDSFVAYTGKIKQLNGDIVSALKAHNLPGDYLNPIFTCAYCEDKGIIYEDDAIPVRCPHCNQVQVLKSINFDDFNLDIFSKEKPDKMKFSPYEIMERNFTVAKGYCNEFPQNAKKNLLFFGASGLGKSFLASCMCSAIREKGYRAVKINAFTLMDEFKKKHIAGEGYSEDYFGCDFLAIDDIGTEPMYNNITVEYLFALVNERMEQGRATLYITNQSYNDCALRYDERLASRIFDELGTIRLLFIGENRRMSK